MDIRDCRIDLLVRTRAGRTGIIKEINNAGVVINLVGGGEHGAAFNCIEPVSDPCASCEMAATITSQCKQIAELQKEIERARLKAFWEGKAACYDQISSLIQSRDSWQADAMRYARNAHYWRDELYKLQKESLECKPLGEVAKIYIQVSPDELDRILKMRD